LYSKADPRDRSLDIEKIVVIANLILYLEERTLTLIQNQYSAQIQFSSYVTGEVKRAISNNTSDQIFMYPSIVVPTFSREKVFLFLV